jgi:hypothetical protein
LAIEEIENCKNICTNGVSGIGSRFCDGNSVGGGGGDSSGEMCSWGEGEDGNVKINDCSCEGKQIPDECESLEISSTSECKKFKSMKGPCFFNGGSEEGEGICSDVVSITECTDFKDRVLCSYAKKYTYPYLESYSSASNTTFLCLWNVGEGCQSKGLGRSSSEEDGGKISSVALIIIIVVGSVVLVGVVLIMVIIMRRIKSRKNERLKEYEMQHLSNSLANTSNSLTRSSCLIFVFFIFSIHIFFFFFFVYFIIYT